MSLSIAKTSELSDKFANDLEKFFIWVVENDYVLTDTVQDSEIDWDMELVRDFEEPGRNKMESFLKKLMKIYSLTKDNEQVIDIKTMVKNFKENKPKHINKKEKRVVKKVVESKKEIEVNVKFDTSDTFYIDTLEFSTCDLIKVFGKPYNTGTRDSKHQYEWKIMVGGSIVYSVYNWLNEDGEHDEFSDNEWHVASTKEDKISLSKLNNFISNKLQVHGWDTEKTATGFLKIPATKQETENEVEEAETDIEVEEAETDIEVEENEIEEAELELDIIEDDEEICCSLDLDDIEF